MYKVKHFFSNQFEELRGTTKRFYLPFVLLIAWFLTLSYRTVAIVSQDVLKYFVNMECTLVFGIFTSILAKIFYEKHFKNRLNKFIVDAVSLACSVSSYIFLYYSDGNVFVKLALSGIIISEIIFILYFSKSDSMPKTFSYYLTKILFNFFACAIMFSGAAICVLAFTTLIYDFNDSFKAYLVLGEFVGIVLFGSMCLSIILRPCQEISVSKVFKIIVSKIMLPIYMVLLLILYVYLGKILFTWTFPSGQVNWFTSFSSLLFVFFAFSLSRYKNENKSVNLFLKFGGLAVIPTIAMQFIAIYIRVSNYGLTTSRYVSIVLNIFALIFAVMFSFKGEKSLKYSLWVLSGLVLLVTVTPLNVIDIPMREQSHRLKTLLINNGMLVNNSIVSNSSLDQEEKIKIIESYKYVKDRFETSNYKPDFLNKDLIGRPSKEIFGFEKTYQRGETVYEPSIHFYFTYDFIDISNYSKLYVLPNSIALKVENNEVVLKSPIDKSQVIEGLYDCLKDIYLKYKDLNNESIDTEKIEYEFGKSKLVLPSITLYQDKDGSLKISYHSDCYLLEK